MKKQKLQTKKILPLLASFALLSGPVLLVTACDHSINRYPTSLPENDQSKIILDFVGVNYNKTAQSEFKAALGNPDVMKAVQKEIEGIMAQQEFFNFFTKKLNYTDKQANDAFNKIKNTLGTNILANRYFTALNNDQDFDGNIYSNNNLIFQTDNWFLNGTNKFDYSKDTKFYGTSPDHNPNTVFTPTYLYANLGDNDYLQNIIDVATHADNPDTFNELMATPGFNSGSTYTGPTTQPLSLEPFTQSTPTPKPDDIQNYQLKVERFKWLLRFRYSQYYVSQIEPQLNEDLFTMANILDSILKTSKTDGQPTINIDTGTYADQLQSWTNDATKGVWTSNFRYTWDYTTSVDSATEDQKNWKTDPNADPNAPNPNLVKNNELNPDFFTKFTSGDKSLKNIVDPLFGTSGYMTKTDSLPYKDALNNGVTTAQAGWAQNSDSNWWENNNKGSFAYTAPIFWIDDILNLNFNWGASQDKTKAITIDQNSPSNINIISNWKGTQTAATTDFSKYIRSDGIDSDTNTNYIYKQNLKWNLFWQMLYSIATQNSDSPNTNGKNNYTAAGKSLYPQYIKKENVYSIEFWNQISSNYS